MNYRFFENKQCEYYPCHNFDKINCLFCFCPLYHFSQCGGDYRFCKSIKDCSNCKIPHSDEGYDYIIDRIISKEGFNESNDI